jgi:hypothetical protein
MTKFLAGPQAADEALSDAMRAFIARQNVEKTSPLCALAFHAIAIAHDRSDRGTCCNSQIATLAEEAYRALVGHGIDVAAQLDRLYPAPEISKREQTIAVYRLMREGRS